MYENLTTDELSAWALRLAQRLTDDTLTADERRETGRLLHLASTLIAARAV